MTRFLFRGLFLGALAALLLLPATEVTFADDAPLSPEEEERLEAIDRHTERGWKAFETGNHQEVLARMKRLRRYTKDGSLPDYLTARVYERTGKYAEALEITTKGIESWPDLRSMTALHLRVLGLLGRWETVEKDAAALIEKNPDNLAAWAFVGRAHEDRGRRTDALAAYDEVIKRYNAIIRGSKDEDPDPTDVPYVAFAAERATWLSDNPADDMLQAALKLIQTYSLEREKDLDVKYQIGEIFRADASSKGQAKARTEYREILKQNSEYADARVGQAKTDLVFYQQSNALKQLERALATNPNHVGALALRAAIQIGNGDYDAGTKALERALTVNPGDKEARSVKAALAWIRGETEAYEALEKEVLAHDPTFARFYIVCAELVGERQRRYDTAADFARKAIATNPTDRWAYVLLGEALMNTGQTDEALVQFQAGVKAAKKYRDVRRDNWIEVLDVVIPRFEVIETEHFRIRMPKIEARVMKFYLPQLLEESYETLCGKYGKNASTPTYADSFDRQDDFSVRSIGSAGLPALGVCFGNVITLLGPTAMPVGGFSWSRTAWHEFAHVVTLQLSNGQVPRWLTEGLSVFEEKQRRDRWGRDMEKQLYDRWQNGRLLKMAEINSAFRGPDILFAYFQGGLISEHLQEERGFEVIPEMLKAFGEDKTTKQVFKDVLGLELAKYDEMFHEYVGSIVGEYRMVPTWDQKSLEAFQDRTRKDPADAEAWVRLAWAHFQRGRSVDAGGALGKAVKLAPEHPEVLLLEASLARKNGRVDIAKAKYEAAIAAGREDLSARLFLAEQAMTQGADGELAIAHLEAAKRCFPRYVAKNSPYLQLAKMFRGAGDFARSFKELEGFAEIAAEDYGVRTELRRWYKQQEDWESLARVCEEMVDITPFGANVRGGDDPDMTLHRDYATALNVLGRADERLRELQVQVEMGRLLDEAKQIEEGVVKDRIALGRAFLEQGRPEDALEQAIGALRLAPADADAIMLKQRASEAGGSR